MLIWRAQQRLAGETGGQRADETRSGGGWAAPHARGKLNRLSCRACLIFADLTGSRPAFFELFVALLATIRPLTLFPAPSPPLAIAP